MEIYLVGGAVRDTLLSYPFSERDWLVVGASPEQMSALGFRAVGKDFPVFLHPDSHEEYALARTERKTAQGYKGFSVYCAPEVSIEEDLQRRDLTINAMAMHPDGRLIDPYGGKADLEQRLLRHVSPAFVEDPVRILRLARFAARYAHLGFRIAPETSALMHTMVTSGEVDALVAERVWAELHKALLEKTPAAFFATLRECGALAKIFPEIDNLFGVPQPAQHHPEIDTGVHCLLVLEQAALLSSNASVRFAALVHDLGKAVSPKDNLPHHHGHEKAGLPILKKLCQRLRVPNHTVALANLVVEYHGHCHKAKELRPSTMVELLGRLGAFKKDNNHLEDFLLACEADARGRTGFEQRVYPQADFVRQAARAALSINTAQVVASELQGADIGQAITQLRINAVHAMKQAVL